MQLSFIAPDPVRVLMICLGNICRSPLAHGILLHEAGSRGIKLIVDSAGTSGLTGSRPDPRSIEVARLNGIFLRHTARKLTRQDFKNFDHLLVMDQMNFTNTLNLASDDEERAKVKLITDFDSRNPKPEIVKDPYYGDMSDFHSVHDQLLICIRGFLDQNFKNLEKP